MASNLRTTSTDDIQLSTLANDDYNFMRSELLLVRESVEGRTAIVNSSQVEEYVPDPTNIQGEAYRTKTPEERRRYDNYVNGAEYDNYPSTTLTAWLGLMDLMGLEEDSVILSGRIAHLVEDFDGDGTSIFESMETTASNIFQSKYHILLSQYGYEFGDLPDQDMTLEESRSLGIKSSVKEYQRENLIDWEFSKVNGVKQLTFARLVEKVTLRDEDMIQSETYNNYVTLALDENNEYYQQIQYGTEGSEKSDRVYPLANGARLNFIPLTIIVDQPEIKGKLPRALGELHPICRKAISRMQTSASLNRALGVIVPTPFTSGWKQQDAQLFKELNGRDNVVFGSGQSNQLPEGVTVDVVSLASSDNALFQKLDDNAKEARALGARFETEDSTEKTATEIRARNDREEAILHNVASSIENGYAQAIMYCALFEGDDSAQIEINLNKDFSNSKLTVEERKAIEGNVLSGLITRDEGRKEMRLGGIPLDEDEEVFGFSDSVASDEPVA